MRTFLFIPSLAVIAVDSKAENIPPAQREREKWEMCYFTQKIKIFVFFSLLLPIKNFC